MTSRKDRIGDPYEVKTYVMYDLYECMLSDFVMLRYKIWLCMSITLMNSKGVYLVYTGVWDSMSTFHKWSYEEVVREVYLWCELNDLLLSL